MVKDFKEDRNKQLNELRKAMWYMDEKFSTNIVSEKTTTTKKKKKPNQTEILKVKSSISQIKTHWNLSSIDKIKQKIEYQGLNNKVDELLHLDSNEENKIRYSHSFQDHWDMIKRQKLMNI
jgi:hypothetical protein